MASVAGRVREISQERLEKDTEEYLIPELKDLGDDLPYRNTDSKMDMVLKWVSEF